MAKGTKEVADQKADQVELSRIAEDVRRFVFDEECRRNPKLPGCPQEPLEAEFQAIEVAELENKPTPAQERESTVTDDEKSVDEKKKDEEKKKEEPLKITPPKVELPKPPPPPPPPPPPVAKKEEKKEVKVAVVPKEEEKKPLPPPPDKTEKKIAVRQHVDPNQKDNPNAHFLGDEANHVKEETVARQTNLEKDDKDPTPAGNHTGPTRDPGDADKTRIAQNEDVKGEKNVAPGQRGRETDITKPMQPPPPQQPGPIAKADPMQQRASHNPDNHPRGSGPQAAAVQPQPQPKVATGGASRPATPDLTTSPNGAANDVVAPPRPANSGNSRSANLGPGSLIKPQLVPQPAGGSGGPLGRGMPGFNLNQQQIAENVVGKKAIDTLRVADGERRRSEHRGSWRASNLERWRSAIENYVSSVKPGNQTALNTAASPFATYLNGMHNRIHPIFADSFLASLDSLPHDNPMNDPKVFTRLEIVLAKDGQLVKMGIVKASGITAFDVAALDSVFRAQPFGPAPSAIVSPDGKVYLHWEFHRDEVYACSTMNARPFLLNVPPVDPNQQPVQPPPGNPPGPRERGLPPTNTHETREGALPIGRHDPAKT